MSNPLAVDMLSTTISPTAIKQAGYVGVLRYLRNLTAAEVNGYLAAGLGVGSIFEYAADESLQGAAKGTADGQLAVQQMTAVGQPPGTLHTVNLADFAPTASELPAIRAYWDAYLAETAAWRVYPYGTGWLLEQLGVAGWQNAMNDNGVPGSTVVPQAAIYQRVTPTLPQISGTAPGSYDEDVILAPVPWWTSQQPPQPPPFIGKQVSMFVAKSNDTNWKAFLIREADKVYIPDTADLQALTAACGQAEAVPLTAAFLATIPDAPAGTFNS